PININAWYGLITVYNADPTKTEKDYYDLAKDIAENLKYFPLPMQHLTNLIKPKMTSVEYSYMFTLLQTRTLEAGAKTPNNTADKYYVYQPSVTKTEANYLLGKLDKTIATFSFDGADGGKIVFANRFSGVGFSWDYSIGVDANGNRIWSDKLSFTAEEEHKWALTPTEIASITSANDIYIHIVGTNREDPNNWYKIDIIDGRNMSEVFYANDLENRVVGVTLVTEWKYSEEDEWTSYSVSSPDLTGTKTVIVRQGATGTSLASAPLNFTFTPDDDREGTRKYIPVSHLSIAGVSTQATSNGGAATNAIDANYNTRYHSAWNGTDTERYITIRLDNPVYLSAVEFVPAGGGNGRIVKGTIYGSMTGSNDDWEVLASNENSPFEWKTQATTTQQAKTLTKSFEIAEPKQVQYVKIKADKTNGNWFAARAFNLFEDVTQKGTNLTAEISYSTTEKTNGNVIARLINPSAEINITNNNGNDTYIFTENDKFTFEFEEKANPENKGAVTANVTWIDKDTPTADVEYKLDNNK
ncbi:MAG: discoidin domain-containing protein, partial [Clostridia bacterium]|nr:discoidin domain-containing protein [Clostridia bacterium]